VRSLGDDAYLGRSQLRMLGGDDPHPGDDPEPVGLDDVGVDVHSRLANGITLSNGS